MKDEFAHRLGMFAPTLLNLNTAKNKMIWFEQDRKVFTVKVVGRFIGDDN